MCSKREVLHFSEKDLYLINSPEAVVRVVLMMPMQSTLQRFVSVMDDADVSYQFAELGKVDAGGGGTIAYIMANYGMEVIDSGVAVLSMHAPWEVTSKADVYEAYKGYVAFLKNM